MLVLDRGPEPLAEQECVRLLGTTGIGRVAYTEAALPAIRLVSFTLREDALVIPTRAGGAWVSAVRGAVVAVEAGSYDDTGRVGWSVTVVGPSWVVPADQPEDPDCCLVVVRLGLVRGWRTTPSTWAVNSGDTAART